MLLLQAVKDEATRAWYASQVLAEGWYLDKPVDMPPPAVLRQEIVDPLEVALLAFRDVAAGLPKSMPKAP